MADNSAQNATDTIRDKDRSGVKTQIFGLDVGIGTGTEALMSSTNPAPTYRPDTVATGTISATDAVVAAPAGTGAFVTGTSTAGSYVAVACPNGDATWNAQMTGTFGTGGICFFEGSLDSTNGIDGQWISLNGRQTGVLGTNLQVYSGAAGLFRGETSGLKYFRVRSQGASTTPTVAVVIRMSAGGSATFLNASVPTGTNNIGLVRQTGAASVAVARVTPTTSAATLVAARATRERLIITNNSNQTVYVGPATVTTANGYPIAVGYTLTLQTTILVQCIIASGTASADVACVEEYD